MLDILIKNANIVDGTGKPSYVGDVGIKDGKIVLGDDSEAKEVIDAAGLMLTPGLIDSHSHSDRFIGIDPNIYSLPKISQGITTEIGGQCGSCTFPVPEDKAENIREFFTEEMTDEHMEDVKKFRNFKTYIEYVDKAKKPGNYAFLQGHGMLRASVMSMANRKPTQEELELMKKRLKESMEQGCLGLSSGLIYVPSLYADREELIELCKVIKPYGGIYATHMRSESDYVIDGVKEAIAIAKEAQVPLFISHHKICGARNWGASEETLRLVHEAIREGMQITMDQYPYLASQTGLVQCMDQAYMADGPDAFAKLLMDKDFREKMKKEMTTVPPKFNSSYQNANGFGGVFVQYSPNVTEAVGKTVEEYAKEIGKDPFDAYFDMMIANKCMGGGAFFCMDDKDMDRIYMDENTVVCTDGVVGSLDGPTHPRAYGSLVRALCQFVKEKHLVTFEEAIRKETSLTAARWGLVGKGVIADGMDADLVLMDYDKLEDKADFVNSRELCEGIVKVFVNGKVAYEDKKITDAFPGKAILRQGTI